MGLSLLSVRPGSGVPHVFLSRLQLLRCPSESIPPTVPSRRHDGVCIPPLTSPSLPPPSASLGCKVSTLGLPRVCLQYNIPLTLPQEDAMCHVKCDSAKA